MQGASEQRAVDRRNRISICYNIRVLYSLFKKEIWLNALIVGISFFVILLAGSLNQLYEFGLITSFNNTVPGITIEATGEEIDLNEIESALKAMPAFSEILACSQFVTNYGELSPIQLKELGAVMGSNPDYYRLNRTRITGLEFREYPYAISFMRTRIIPVNEHTIREIEFRLHQDEKAVVINQALLFGFSAREAVTQKPTITGRDKPMYKVQDENLRTQVDSVQVLGTMNDFKKDTPAVYTSFRTAEKMIKKENRQYGIYLRLKQPRMIEEVMKSIETGLEKQIHMEKIRVFSWKDKQSGQQQLNIIYSIVFVAAASIVTGLAVLLSVLLTYRNFIFKRQSLSAVQNIGTSSLSTIASTAILFLFSTIVGLLSAVGLLKLIEKRVLGRYIIEFREIIPINPFHIDWSSLLTSSHVIGYVIFFFLSLYVAVYVSVDKK